jgi:hypothetical protein
MSKNLYFRKHKQVNSNSKHSRSEDIFVLANLSSAHFKYMKQVIGKGVLSEVLFFQKGEFADKNNLFPTFQELKTVLNVLKRYMNIKSLQLREEKESDQFNKTNFKIFILTVVTLIHMILLFD